MISQENSSKVECIREYKKDAETLLKVLSEFKSATESIQKSPKKARAPRVLASGE